MNFTTYFSPLLADWGPDLVSGFNTNQRFVLLIVAIGCATLATIAITAIVSNMYTMTHRRQMEMEMKRDMIDRGMSAEEIEKVVECASAPENAADRWVASWGKCDRKTG